MGGNSLKHGCLPFLVSRRVATTAGLRRSALKDKFADFPPYLFPPRTRDEVRRGPLVLADALRVSGGAGAKPQPNSPRLTVDVGRGGKMAGKIMLDESGERRRRSGRCVQHGGQKNGVHLHNTTHVEITVTKVLCGRIGAS